ncbi:uncharacterized protein LOC126783402 [Argentina anserina]|uniref:uncharacterized protein LOC126783402 n=1 Tax=Argentina anserina TaxID=57926 RepID=UPI002176618A|nr:uncharacterized protein LOC126783402 [Potentilla anserina]
MEESSSSRGIIPEPVMDSVKSSLGHLEQVGAELPQFLALCSDPDVLAQMPPIDRAHSLLLLSNLTTTLFTLRLRCSGVYDEDHRVNSELERLKLYQEKLQRFIDLSQAPLRPSTTLNYQAATRFIEHSLPDLTPDQRQSMRDISKGEAGKMKYLERNVQKKRKFQSPNTQSVQSAAKEFLEKAARDLLGDDHGGVKGPLRAGFSDKDNLNLD